VGFIRNEAEKPWERIKRKTLQTTRKKGVLSRRVFKGADWGKMFYSPPPKKIHNIVKKNRRRGKEHEEIRNKDYYQRGRNEVLQKKRLFACKKRGTQIRIIEDRRVRRIELKIFNRRKKSGQSESPCAACQSSKGKKPRQRSAETSERNEWVIFRN